ncbi:MAG TPA: adenylate/guanylate cyclase domain-containing protein, partial [Isosphaeraceae bacterium]|nr:adenylate/guanylate cyclase domain-containing protein [Isosphaeraceae bacterium]
MADLIAQGREPHEHWRNSLPEGQWLVLGRGAGTLAVTWDDMISRRHAELCWRNGQLQVRRLETARNPIYVRGQESIRFDLKPGEHFVVGGTTFTLADEHVAVTAEASQPVEERAYDKSELDTIRYHNADHRLDVLARLPDVISGASNEHDLQSRLVTMILAGIPRADAVALVACDPSKEGPPAIRLLHWDRRLSATGGRFQPSARLIRAAVRKQQSVSHLLGATIGPEASSYTVAEGLDWAFCTPVRNDSAEAICIYVAGRFAQLLPSSSSQIDPTDLRDDLKFTELVAAILKALIQVRKLQRSQAVLSQFFAPVVLSSLAESDANEVLAPRQTDVSVLFCDLRGFSLESEKHADDLFGLLERVSKALRVMTHQILDQGGVIGDFQGDAAMGFWGWPLAQPDTVPRACLAALAIRAQFEANAAQPGHPLADFQVGIGIATGKAVAGRIGTLDQAKVSVFGPVVNLASRLEGMTRLLHTSILLDEATAQVARAQLTPEQARFRRIARVKPFGLESPVTITELLPPL